MIRVPRTDEPMDFDQTARKPGLAWLASNPNPKSKPPDYWSPFRDLLAKGFGNRCGYLAMFDPDGTVDHFISFKTNPSLSYEWSNYRYSAGTVNSAKKPRWDGHLLDPFEVENDWFEIQLPSCLLSITNHVPLSHLAKAKFTLEKLKLADGQRARRQRLAWYDRYLNGKVSIDGLQDFAPQVARAVEKWISAGRPLPSLPAHLRQQYHL
jgi:hypothetical protein